MAKQIVKLTVNGRQIEALVEPRTLLIHFLREELGLKGAHIGETSHCGACTVDIDGQSVKSCTMFSVQAEGAEVVTVEGLAQDGSSIRCRRPSSSITGCSAGSVRPAC